MQQQNGGHRQVGPAALADLTTGTCYSYGLRSYAPAAPEQLKLVFNTRSAQTQTRTTATRMNLPNIEETTSQNGGSGSASEDCRGGCPGKA
jgi:hypothetical protein